MSFPARAVSLAFAQVARETTKKVHALSLKRKTDEDVEMWDDTSRSDNVGAVVRREMGKLMKEYKIQKTGTSPTARSVSDDTTDSDCRKGQPEEETENQCLQTEAERQALWGPEGRKDGQPSRRQRKRQAVEQEVEALSRAWAAPSGVAGLASRLQPGSLRVGSTDAASTYLTTNSELFCNVSHRARIQFVAARTPVALLEVGHRLEDGVFMGPGVVIPVHIEWQLALNLKFIMHHPPNPSKVFQAWEHLERSVRIAWHFRDSSRLQSKFYVPKRTWMPPAESWNHAIETGLIAGKDLLLERATALTQHQAHRSNPDLRQLQSFLESNQLLVKITDKNLGVAAISKSWYQEQCDSLLANDAVYLQIDEDDVSWVQREAYARIQTICENASFSPEVTEYLLSSNDGIRLPVFHAIPKVHKTPWNLRPIVPSHSWVTTKASKVCDFALRALQKQCFPWVVDSTKEVIHRLERLTLLKSDPIWLVTGDVESFYTNVPIADAIRSLRSSMQVISPSAGVDMTAVADLAEVVMHTNCFRFGQKYFHQQDGVAMGTPCAPSFANCYLAARESQSIQILDACRNVDGLIHYARYIDDILIVFKGPESALRSCLENLSTRLRPFKIGWEIHSTRDTTPFLDIEFFWQTVGHPGLQSRVFRKRLNKHQYIPWSSAHPITVKKAFIKAELTRYMVICSSKALFEERVAEFMLALRRRGYPSDRLNVWRHQVQYIDRSWFLSKEKDPAARGVPLLLPSSYDSVWDDIDVNSVLQEMQQHWRRAGEPLPPTLQGPLVKSLRRTDNLFDKLSSWNKAVLALDGPGLGPAGGG